MLKNVLPILHSRVAAVAPIHGCSLEGISFRDEATAQQRAAAQAILDAFDPVQAQAEIAAEAKAAAEKAAAIEKLADWMQKNPLEAVKLMEATAKLAVIETKVAAIEAKVAVAPK